MSVRHVVAVDGAVVVEPNSSKITLRPEHALGGLFGLARHARAALPPNFSTRLAGAVVQVIVAWGW